MTKSDTTVAGNEINCPGCGAVLGYFDAENSSYYGCAHCYTFFRYEYEGPPEVLRQFIGKKKPSIPIGAKGRIDGEEYTVVGYMRKNENGETQQWNEYVLYREHLPYIILVEYDGDWVVVRKSNKDYRVTQQGMDHFMIYDQAETYTLYHSYKFNIVYAEGEFDWNILAEEHMITYEYMSGNTLLVNEVLGSESEWYWGKDIIQEKIAAAFRGDSNSGNTDIPLLYKEDSKKALFLFTVTMLIAVVLVQVLVAVVWPSKTVLSNNYITDQDTTAAHNIKPIITESFTLSNSGPVGIELKTNVDNEWVELGVTMVNETTGDEYESSKAIEYYHGYEDGESWSEGNNDDDISFSHVPSGRYHLNISPYSDVKKQVYLEVRVEQNRHFYSNFWLMLLVVFAWPAILLIRNNAKNKTFSS